MWIILVIKLSFFTAKPSIHLFQKWTNRLVFPPQVLSFYSKYLEFSSDLKHFHFPLSPKMITSIIKAPSEQILDALLYNLLDNWHITIKYLFTFGTWISNTTRFIGQFCPRTRFLQELLGAILHEVGICFETSQFIQNIINLQKNNCFIYRSHIQQILTESPH